MTKTYKARLGRLITGGALAAAVLAVAPAGASAANFTCSATLSRDNSTILNTTLDPIRANATPGASCADDSKTADKIVLGPLSADAAFARTSIDPDGPPTSKQSVVSETGAASVVLKSPDGSVVLSVDGIESRIATSCTAPASISSKIAQIRLGNTIIPLDPLITLVGDGINAPLGTIIRIRTNVTDFSPDGNTITRRALEVQVFNASGTPLIDQVLGEASVGRVGGDPCVDPPGPSKCPIGTQFDPLSNFCVIREVVKASDSGGCPVGSFSDLGQCVRFIPVDALGNPILGGGAIGPLGGVVGISKSSPCFKDRRFGQKRYAIIGTNKSDRVTGTNRADRIFLFGGNDRVSGGRGGDCIDAGSGNDVGDADQGNDLLLGLSGRDILNGSSGRDQVRGGSGKDKLDGGSGKDMLKGESGNDKLSGALGNDTMIGASGKDRINTGNGRDRVNGGAGNDEINAATSGPRAKINCGKGRDRARVNNNERHTSRSCERLYVQR